MQGLQRRGWGGVGVREGVEAEVRHPAHATAAKAQSREQKRAKVEEDVHRSSFRLQFPYYALPPYPPQNILHTWWHVQTMLLNCLLDALS